MTVNNQNIGATIALEFDKSIKNMKEFGVQLEQLDHRFGSIEKRIDTMKSSLSSLSAQTSKAAGSNLRAKLEQELNNIVQANGITLSSVGTAPLSIKQETVQQLMSKVDKELNKTIVKMIKNININMDSAMNNSVVPVGKDEFNKINKEISKLISNQIKQLVNSIRENGGDLVNADNLSGLKLDISKGTVKQILVSIKNQLKPILLNPEVAIEGQTFTISSKDLSELTKKVRGKIKDSIKFDFEGVISEENSIDSEIIKTAKRIDSLIENYIKGIRGGLQKIDLKSVEVPMKNISKQLQRYIANDLGVSPAELAHTFHSVDRGSLRGYALKRQFEGMENTINKKLTAGTNKIMMSMKQSVRAVDFEPHSNITQYLTSEINKLNKQIIKKIKESVDKQFAHIRNEILEINTNPQKANSNRQVSFIAGNSANTLNNSSGSNHSNTNKNNSDSSTSKSTKQDNPFDGFGMAGAVTKQVRSLASGSMLDPMAAISKAMETFKIAQLEQLKITQNFSLKPEYKNKNGNTDWLKLDNDTGNLMNNVRDLSTLYGIDYERMSKVAGIASNVTGDKQSARQFVDQASKVYRLDNKSDLVETIAPGLQTIMAQFKLSVWELDGVVNSFAVATSQTKANSEDVMKAMSKSGTALHSVGVNAEDAVTLNALAIQTSGETGENAGAAIKTIAERITLPSVSKQLENYGVKVFEKNESGMKVRRNFIDILSDTAKASKNKYIGEDKVKSILYGEGGANQPPKLMSFLETMHKEGINNSKDLSYWKIKQEINEFKKDPARLQEMMAVTMKSPTVTMERAGVSVNNALVSVLDALNPEVQTLAKIITNLAQGMEKHAGLFAQLITILGNALVGFGAIHGVKRLGQLSNYEEHYKKATMENKFFGGTSLTNRKVDGAIGFLNDHVLGESQDLRNQVNNKKFYRAAMKNDTLKSYFEELANLKEDRKNEIKEYVKDHGGKAENMSDFLSIMDESKGYYKGEKKELTADELHTRSAYNARNLTQSKLLTDVFTTNFSEHLVNTLSNRTNFDSMNENQKSTAGRLAQMDDQKRIGFETYLDQNYQSVGKSINNMDGLNKALDEYEANNRKATIQTRQSTTAYRDLSSAVKKVADEAEGASKNRMQGFLDFLDTIPQRTRGAGGAIMGLARSVGKFAKQLAIATAVGDVLSNSAESLGLTPKQTKIRDYHNQTAGAAEAYVKYEEDEGWSGFLRGAGLAWNGITNLFSPGTPDVGINEVGVIKDWPIIGKGGFKEGFENWIKKEYGTSDWNEALGKENEKRANDAKSKGQDGNYSKASLTDLTQSYLNQTGMYAKKQQLEKEEFIDQYTKAAISESEQNMRRDDAEKARKARENKMLGEGQYDSFSYDDLKSRIQESQKVANNKGELNLITALLDGVKADSKEYMKLRLQVIQQEREAYKKEMDELHNFTQQREAELEYLEKNGKRYTEDPETKERIETDDYKKIKESVERSKDKEKKLKADFDLEYKKKQIEAQRIKTEFYVNDTQKGFSRAQAKKQYKDTLNAISMNTESPTYIDSQIVSSQSMIGEMKSKLANLQSQQLADPDGQLQDTIQGLSQQIASAELEVKNLRIQRLTAWRHDFGNNMDDLEIKYMQERVNFGPSIGDDSFLARDLRVRELQDRKSLIDKTLAVRIAERNSGKFEEGSSEYEQVMKDIRELTKQSLQAQIGIHQELRAQMGGTFNLPEGVQVMSQYDYLTSKGTHSNFSVQSGDMYVNITLPNVTGQTSSQQLANLGMNLGKGLAQGRTTPLRNQLNSAPWGYPTF
ncbi:phage tail tape measure protein [Bacillus cereus]|uniref:phage tail tape measure protein n=1 Tax=Bacillus cereus TaxID=1396 RepID=UPI000BF25771|nr:phage tail tape measure protein [Bacillus cereus]MDR4440623.1 phage tail tape measure protein [Bacillus cereus]PFC81314.1 phage tail tape measure protein [Bacillus cereus]PGQ93832.1 phage tail tape measure protein [Bacillus cereus]